MNYFTYISRLLPLTFFSADPIEITLPICDATDSLLLEMAKSIDAADTAESALAALYPVLGKDNSDAIFARSDPRDVHAVRQIAAYILRQYGEGVEKNLSAAQLGRQLETDSTSSQTD